ncbi:uncharacterized protein LOC106158672 [Lingula anatina]|uniref:Uncharacterized protein LOC106158672 n=1 Tax=Lingula anatina TaxID=7574 RepID=A0A1S3HVZ4_LINAN|nr:uncharacterized protein LOC106158672 [Lingula anatina]|eukprot:XP_013390205.1 uncharacterized protein LOC106158672 [Lingula anatina]
MSWQYRSEKRRLDNRIFEKSTTSGGSMQTTISRHQRMMDYKEKLRLKGKMLVRSITFMSRGQRRIIALLGLVAVVMVCGLLIITSGTAQADVTVTEAPVDTFDYDGFERKVRQLLDIYKVNSDPVMKVRFVQNPITMVYELVGKPFIWLFWEGPLRPAYIDLCILSIICHNEKDFHIKVFNSTQFAQSVDYLQPMYHSLNPAHKSDYFRAAILSNYGGMYFDVDTISFKSMREYLDLLGSNDIVGSRRPSGEFHVGNMGPFRMQTEFTKNWIMKIHQTRFNTAHKALASGADPFKGTELGTETAQPVFEEQLGLGLRFHNIEGSEAWFQFSTADLMSDQRDFAKEMNETHLIVLQNKDYLEGFRRMDLSAVLRSKLGVAQLLRRSLQKCADDIGLV